MRASRLFATSVVGVGAVLAQNATNTTGMMPVLIKPCFYNNIVRYTKFAAASYPATTGSMICQYPPYGSVQVASINTNSTSTQAALFRDDDREEFILTFPGTDSGIDFATDFNYTKYPYMSPGVNCPGCMVHGGYLKAYNSIVGELQRVLDISMDEYSCYDLVLTGHSLGAAIAALAFPSLKGLGYPIKYLYNYGQPRIGDNATCEYIDRLSGASDTKYGTFRRVTHSFDGVPNLPPTALGYSHPLTEFFERDIYLANGTIVPKANDNANVSGIVTEAANATFRCFGGNSLYCNTGYAQGFINPAHLQYSGISMINGGGCHTPPSNTSSNSTFYSEAK